MGKLRQCDARVNCDGETTSDPGRDGWTAVFAGVMHADPQGGGVETSEVMPGMVAVSGSAGTDEDHLDLCPACAGEVRAQQVTDAFLSYLEEFDGADD